MPVIWGTHNKSDIFIDVAIIDASTINLTTSPPIGGTIPTPILLRALLDTGAQKTMISPKVINTLNLRPLGKILISGVGPTAHFHNGYLFHVAFVAAVILPGQVLVPGSVVQSLVNILRDPVYGAEIPSSGEAFDVLLGMDIISTGSLVVQGNGTYSFSY
jgi:hypothetical protein